jgi:hypothetical protein
VRSFCPTTLDEFGRPDLQRDLSKGASEWRTPEPKIASSLSAPIDLQLIVPIAVRSFSVGCVGTERTLLPFKNCGTIGPRVVGRRSECWRPYHTP